MKEFQTFWLSFGPQGHTTLRASPLNFKYTFNILITAIYIYIYLHLYTHTILRGGGGGAE
jgi:hypothetical protein